MFPLTALSSRYTTPGQHIQFQIDVQRVDRQRVGFISRGPFCGVGAPYIYDTVPDMYVDSPHYKHSLRTFLVLRQSCYKATSTCPLARGHCVHVTPNTAQALA